MLLSNYLKPIVICTAAFISTHSFAETMTRAEYTTAKDSISSTYKSEKKACSASTGNSKDICKEQAKGKEKIARAELEFKRSNSISDNRKVSVAKADSAYAIAKEMCDDKAGEPKSLCKTEAKATHTKAIASSKLIEKVGEAKVDAKKDMTDADYKVAIEKCESAGGDAKTACIASAKTKFNKN
jgi:hypothetical protein